MVNAISTKVVKLDLATILKNYKNPEFWKKEWVIFKHADLKITWKITRIDCVRNEIESRVFLSGSFTKKRKKHFFGLQGSMREISSYCRVIPIDHGDYSQETFARNILETSLDVLRYGEYEIIKSFYEYQAAVAADNEENDRLTEIAEDFLDSQGVHNSEIRDVYIDHYVSTNQSFSMASRVLTQYEYKVMPGKYLLLCSFFDNKKCYEKYKEKTGTKAKKMIYEIWQKGRELNSKEWVEEMKDQLEDIV